MASTPFEEELAKQTQEKQLQEPPLSDSTSGISKLSMSQTQKFPDFTTHGLFIPTAVNFSIKFDGLNYCLWHLQLFASTGSSTAQLLCLSLMIRRNLRWCDQDALLQ